MSSDIKKPKNLRREPKQERSAEKVQVFLNAAEAVFVEAGYQAATMTEIARQAQASIGAVYQYFPNKEAIAVALRSAYAQQMDDAWSVLASGQEQFTLVQLVNDLFDLMIDFIDAHPAYLLLLEAPIGYARDRKAKEQLRERVGALLVTKQLASDVEQGLLKANVVLQIVKGLIPLYAAGKAAERGKLIAEFKLAVRRYLSPA